MDTEVRYARSGDAHIAFAMNGTGPPHLLLIPDGWVPMEVMTEEPRFDRFLERLASFTRLLRFDRRGIGLSDPIVPSAPPTLEQWMEDGRAVLDASESDHAAVLGIAEGGYVAVLLAATHPEQVAALVLVNAMPCISAPPFNTWGALPNLSDVQRRSTQEDRWGDDLTGMEIFAPSAANDDSYRAWLSREMRRSVSPSSAAALMDLVFLCDVRDVLPSVRVPTLVIHREGDRWLTPEHGRYLADNIPDATYVEVPGNDHVPYLGDTDSILGEIEEFLTGARRAAEPNRMLATLLFTDIVGSTEHASRVGDRAWHELLEQHDKLVRRHLERHDGQEVKTTGDGFLATFDGPARAIRCAYAIRDSMDGLGLEVRAGIHTGECEVRGGDVGGIAVHIAQRVQSRADPNEILVSSTVRDLVAGSGIRFVDRGEHELKGVSGTRQLFAVDGV